MNVLRRKHVAFLSVVMCCASMVLDSHRGAAAVVFTVDSKAVEPTGVGPTMGSIDVYLQVSDESLGIDVRNWTSRVLATNFTGTITSVELGPVSEPISRVDLFPDSPVAPTPGTDSGGGSSFADESNPSLFDGAGLMSVAFHVPAGQTGSFDIVFATVSGNSLFDSGFQPIPFTSQGAKISVSAVPEPSSLLFAVGAISIGGYVRLRRKQACLRTYPET